MKKDESIFIKCSCGSEGIGIDYDADDELYYFSVWSEGLSSKTLTIKERIRYCWRVITKGKAFNDQLILTKQEVIKLDNFLLDCMREKF